MKSNKIRNLVSLWLFSWHFNTTSLNQQIVGVGILTNFYIQSPKFDVQIMLRKRKQQDRAEGIVSGISPEVWESDVLLDELIELFDAAAVDQSAASQHLKEKPAADIAKAEEIQRASMETLGETRKRRGGEKTDEI